MRAFKFAILLVVSAAIVIGAAYVLITKHVFTTVENRIFPCASPIAYSLGSFDARFGVSQKDFLADIAKAAQIWDTGASKTLFAYDPSGALKINLIYDSRQQNTELLAKIGVVLSGDQTTYDQLKTKYDSFQKTYEAQKQQYDALVADFQSKQKIYNDTVAYWNARGGAPRTEFNNLNLESSALSAEVRQINDMQKSINDLVDTVNVLVAAINQVAGVLNINAAHYNTIGASQGVTFEEGAYVSDLTGPHIDIYQFSDQTKLIRVLAHELGHALGLGHVSSTKSIMYYLNEAGNEKLSAQDLSALKNKCGIQ